MNRRVLALASMLGAMTFLSALASAKSADDYYHGAAYQYVAGKIQEASVEAEEGLRLHPGDDKLSALAEQLRKMKDQQRGNSGNGGDKKDKDKQDGEDKDDQKNPGDEKNPDNEDGDKKGDDEGKQPPKPDGNDQPEDKDERDGQGKAPQGQMSEEEAKRLLNSFADDEKKEQAERRKVIRQRAGTEQDW